jgi:RNA polymerase sigma-70 factor, ECF subfamily
LVSAIIYDMTDEQLGRQYMEGDEKALEALVERYLKPLFNFAYRMTGDRTVSEDIVQEVFVKAWKNMNSYDSQKKFSTWIFAIAKNTAFDFLKKKKAIPFSTFESVDGENFLEFIEDENALHNEEFLKVIDDKKDVAEYLSTLHPQIKTILILHHLHGFSLVEISEIMGHSSNTIKSKYRRAILQLRNQFSF